MSVEQRLRDVWQKLETYYRDLYNRDEFLRSCPPRARVLDVGCGNDSPAHFKKIRPDFYYVGIDIGDYNQITEPRENADEYIITAPQDFSARIQALPASFDAVISAHNIEHCDFPEQTLAAMLGVIKPGGRIYLAFPCEASVNFPHRKGTLNFYDDPTHIYLPRFATIRAAVTGHGFRIDVAKRRYRPLGRVLRGLVNEPRCWRQGIVTHDIWALYGFETIIWATRPHLG